MIKSYNIKQDIENKKLSMQTIFWSDLSANLGRGGDFNIPSSH